MKFNKLKLVLSGCLCSLIATAQQPTQITVQADKIQYPVQENMWGLFFEDINFAADGGLNAELIKNRSFEFYKPMMGWKETKLNEGTGAVLIQNRLTTNDTNPRFLHLTSLNAKGSYGIGNAGFRGMGIKQGVTYHFSVLARTTSSNPIKIKLELIDASAMAVGSTEVSCASSDWQTVTGSLVSTVTDAKASFQLMIEGEGSVDLDMVSLLPADTWKNQPNGFRADLVQKLADLKPGFFRFPGGCIVEGHELETRYQWKKTIGKQEERTAIVNRWNTEMKRRPAPDYFQSYGIGFYEYFVLCQEIGAEPMPIMNCGMACQYNTGEVAPMDELNEFIQDMLDLIEFANGSADSKWGSKRAEMGHPAPFNLKMIGIGNEQWGAQYFERYEIFAAAIRNKYPEIKLISGSGPSPDGKQFEFAWAQLKQMKNVDFVDEHYYKDPNWFFNNARRYDNYDRKGPKIFAGEYACHGKEGDPSESRNTWLSALAEAAFMTGMERNADVVYMASYAPLLAHVEAWQWRPDMIWFDNLRSVATPNYYVQKLFSNNKGTHVIPVLRDGISIAGEDSLYASAVIDKASKQIIVKIVNTSAKSHPVEISLAGVKGVKSSVQIEKMGSSDLYLFNTLDQPNLLIPQSLQSNVKNGKIVVNLDGQSFYVLKVNGGVQ